MGRQSRNTRNAAPAAPAGDDPQALRERLTDVAYPEVALNQKVKNLIQKLGEAIHESVSESEHIAGVVKNIREQGFDVLLMLEATIGLNEVEMDEAETAETGGESEMAADGPFTNHDLTFLKSLRISVSDDQAGLTAAAE